MPSGCGGQEPCSPGMLTQGRPGTAVAKSQGGPPVLPCISLRPRNPGRRCEPGQLQRDGVVGRGRAGGLAVGDDEVALFRSRRCHRSRKQLVAGRLAAAPAAVVEVPQMACSSSRSCIVTAVTVDMESLLRDDRPGQATGVCPRSGPRQSFRTARRPCGAEPRHSVRLLTYRVFVGYRTIEPEAGQGPVTSASGTKAAKENG
jgi:hypothetical protein